MVREAEDGVRAAGREAEIVRHLRRDRSTELRVRYPFLASLFAFVFLVAPQRRCRGKKAVLSKEGRRPNEF